MTLKRFDMEGTAALKGWFGVALVAIALGVASAQKGPGITPFTFDGEVSLPLTPSNEKRIISPRTTSSSLNGV